MRYLTPHIKKDLARKLVLLSGPRQVGKSTLARELLDQRGVYLNWDIRDDKRFIRDIAWRKDATLVILDELHKMPRWKNFIKGVTDQFGNRPPILVTGSARLELLRYGGDALTGRTYHYRLHPFDVEESGVFLPDVPHQERLSRLLEAGGFPEAFLDPGNAARLRNDRLDLVLREDLRDLSKTSDVQAIGLLVELLRERVGSKISFSNLAGDLSISMPTVKRWTLLLERLYMVFLVLPYARGLARSLRKEPKVYFYDCAAAHDERGARLENLVACALLKYCHLQHDAHGRRMQLFYFRDREKREVDFVVTDGTRVRWCIEVKEEDDQLHPPLAYLCERLKPAGGFQLVRKLSRPKEIRGIQILPLADWLSDLSSR